MKNLLGILSTICVLGLLVTSQGCALFSDSYSTAHAEKNKNAWLEKKHGYRKVANYESEKFEERKSKY